MKHLLDANTLSVDDIDHLMKLTDQFQQVLKREIPKVPALRGKTVVQAFFEDSTRTRTSFDLATKRLGADSVNFSASSSALNKGESLRDTIETIDAMGIDAIVVRHVASGTPELITKYTDASVINAGDGKHQHPTQALLDFYTIRQSMDISGKVIMICGDIKNSRVARSNIALFNTLGAKVLLVGPRTLLPDNLEAFEVDYSCNMDEVIDSVDVAYMLRIQKERMEPNLIPSEREYRGMYGLTIERARRMKANSLIMHPGPVNRGVEIDADVMELPNNKILQQVANGVPVRMAVLYSLLGYGPFAD